MHVSRNILALAAGLLVALTVQAQAPAGAPAGSTGLCKDGSYYSGATKKGACRGHKGVKDWYGASATSAAVATPATPVAATPAATRKSSKKNAAAAAPAPMPAGPAPSGATGLCKDGSYYSGATKKGACRGHKGVKDWYGASSVAAPMPAPAPAAAAAAGAPAPRPAAPVAAAPAAPAAPAPSTSHYTPPAVAAAGGGAGLVWVNTASKVYHCQSDSLYGRTKEGSYMTEAAANAAGDRPARGKTCQ